MEYVIGLRSRSGDLVDAARRMEDCGYHGVSTGDHRGAITGSHVWVSLAAAAMATRRVKLVSGFANNLFRHPTEFVQAAQALHRVSGGRFEAGIGAGWAEEELAKLGKTLPPPKERVDRLVEACTIARPLLRGEGCAFRGRHYEARFDPTGEPGPALVAALGGPAACRRVAPLVDRVEVMYGPAVSGGSLDFTVWDELSREELGHRVALVREAAPSAQVGVGVFVAAGAGEEVERLQSLARRGLQRDLVGEPKAVAEGLRSLEELGIDRVGITPLTVDTGIDLAPELLRP